MNELNSVEKRLRSWRPRQPSARVEKAIFGVPEAPPTRQNHGGWVHWQNGWAAGVATLAILLVTAVNLASLHGVPGASRVSIGAALSNASYAASFAAVQHNCLSAPIFGWTNDGELH